MRGGQGEGGRVGAPWSSDNGHKFMSQHPVTSGPSDQRAGLDPTSGLRPYTRWVSTEVLPSRWLRAPREPRALS